MSSQTHFSVGSVVRMLVSEIDVVDRDYRLERFILANLTIDGVPSVFVTGGVFAPIGLYGHEAVRKSPVMYEVSTPWPVAVGTTHEKTVAIEDEFGAVGSVSKNEGSST